MSGSASSSGHLVHGMGLALEAPVWPAITSAEAETILSRFPAAGRLVGLRWHSPRPFSAATLVQTSRGEFLLKRHDRRLRTPRGLAEEHGFISHLGIAGVAVPEIMLANTGASAVAEGEWTYELHRKARGIDLYRDRLSWTPFLSHGHAHAAGAALARMHSAARDFVAPTRRPQPLVASFSILPAHDPLAAAEAYVLARPALAAFLAEKPWRQDLALLFDVRAADLAERLAGEPSLWTHNDWHPSNLLWSSDGEVCTLIDFGLADRSCALHDLATAIERTAIPWLQLGVKGAGMTPDAGAALALLAGYETQLPLSRADRETIVRLLPLVHVEFALSEVDYFAGILADPDHAALAWDGYLIDHANWFLSAPGRDFLDKLDGAGAS
jgi:Ser/Thr protein kinase RdoA (MazF antagonist)